MSREPDDPTGGPTQGLEGEVVGHFRLLRPLGSGGNADVHLAIDRDIPDRRVALKILRGDGVAPFLSHLRHEASVLAALHHPGILVVHEIGESRRGPYLAMEFLEGGSLADRIRRGPVPLLEGLRIARDAADALWAAHGKGILHRDVKPANLLFSEDGRVKLSDFGLASRAASVPPVQPGSDQSTRGPDSYVPPLIAGTPGYIAPEVLQAEPAVAASDQFAWGVTLHQMLTGRHPFEGASWQSMMAGPEPRLDASLPADVGELIRRCLAPGPAGRFASMAEVLGEVDAALLRRDAVRRRQRWRQTGSVALLLLLLLAWSGWEWHRRRREAEEAAARRAGAEELNEAGLLAFEAGRVEEAWKAWNRARLTDPAFEDPCQNLGMRELAGGEPRRAAAVLEECAVGFPESPAIRLGLGQALASLGETERARGEFRRGLALGPRPEVEAFLVNELALSRIAAGQPVEAVRLFEDRSLPGPGTVLGAPLAKTRGQALVAAGRHAEAIGVLRAALDGPLEPRELGLARVALGRALEATGDLVGARKAFGDALLESRWPEVQEPARAGLQRLAPGGS